MDPHPDSSRKPDALSSVERRRSQARALDGEQLVEAFVRVERRSMRRRQQRSEAPPSSRTAGALQALRSTLRRRDADALKQLQTETLEDNDDE